MAAKKRAGGKPTSAPAKRKAAPKPAPAEVKTPVEAKPTSDGATMQSLLPFLVWLPLLGCFAAIQVGTDRWAGNDGYYHIKYAWLLWHEGAVWDFPWLRGTFFHERWVDTEFLFHVLLIPFTIPGDLYLAGKVAPVFYGSLAIFSVYWTIRSFGAPGSPWRAYAWVAALVLMASSHSALYRLSMPRAPAASLLFMMIGIMLIERRETKRLAVLAFFYAWMYAISVALLPIALFFAIGWWFDEDRWNLRPLGYAAAGVVLGFVVNPYFPSTLPVLFNHVVEIGFGTSAIPKGAEWAPYDSWFAFHSCLVAWIALFLGGLSMIGTPARGRHITLLAIAAMMMFAFFKSRRFVEYFPFFAVLFGAGVFHDALQAPGSLVNRVRRAIGPSGVFIVATLVVAALAGVTTRNIRKTTAEMSVNALPTRFEGATAWLKDNTSPGTQVYNVDWDIFPELLFYDHHNHWTLGLDPNFTYEVSRHHYYTMESLRGGWLNEPGKHVQRTFGAQYAFARRDTPFDRQARSPRSGLKQLYSDEHAAVYEVLPTPNVVTLEGELEPHRSNLDKERIRCRYAKEDSPTPGAIPWLFEQCWLKAPEPFVLKYEIELAQEGTYTVTTRFLEGASTGSVQVIVNDRPLGPSIALTADKRKLTQWTSLGQHNLPVGKIPVQIQFSPGLPLSEPKSKRWPIEVGFDALRFRRVSRP